MIVLMVIYLLNGRKPYNQTMYFTEMICAALISSVVAFLLVNFVDGRQLYDSIFLLTKLNSKKAIAEPISIEDIISVEHNVCS